MGADSPGLAIDVEQGGEVCAATAGMTSASGNRRNLRVGAGARAAFLGERAETARKDGLLLDELRRDTPAAVEALFERYHARVYNLAKSILRNESDAEEVVQDVFLTVIRKAHLFKGNSALYSWIYRICVNACLMRLRGMRRYDTVPIEDFLPVFTGGGLHACLVDDWSREVERKALEKELGQVIRRYTDSLTVKYRVVFELCEMEGLSYEETAQILDLGVPAVKSRLHRARLYLRERLTRYLKDGKIERDC